MMIENLGEAVDALPFTTDKWALEDELRAERMAEEDLFAEDEAAQEGRIFD